MVEPKTELEINAIMAARRAELTVFQRALDMAWLDGRMEDGRMARLLALVRREADMEKDYQERTDHAAIVDARAARETALGMEIAEVRREQQAALQRRHVLRERDPGLRALQRQLGAAYTRRDLQHQILCNEHKRLQEKAEEKRAYDNLGNALYSVKEQELADEAKKMEQARKYRHELQQQMVNSQRQKMCQYEETLLEKKMTDEIMRTIADEDRREREQKAAITMRMRDEMETTQRARLAWRDKHRRAVLQEEKEIERQQLEMASRAASNQAEKERLQQLKDEHNARVAAKMLADEEKRKEREDLIVLLQQQEYIEKDTADAIAAKTKIETNKRNMLQALTRQLDEHRKQVAKQKEDEIKYREQVEARVAAQDEAERQKAADARARRAQYAAELRAQAQEEQAQRRQAQQQEQGRAQAVFDYYKDWDAEVAQEREKIVKEHAPPLLGYMQAGALARGDLPAVKEGAAAHPQLASLDIDGLARTHTRKRFPKCNTQCQRLRLY